jgi:RES domain-containing protein
VSGTAVLWRIATETRDYKANDLSGAGSATSPGRWNAAGEHVVYAAPTLSLAVLETAAHLDSAGLPLNRFVVRIEVPADVFAMREEFDPATLDPAWNAIPAGRASAEAGSRWYRAGEAPILLAPSVIVPEERVAIVNARHPAASRIAATTVRRFSYTTLFRP